jgi:GT2 family glycosyltransferase
MKTLSTQKNDSAYRLNAATPITLSDIQTKPATVNLNENGKTLTIKIDVIELYSDHLFISGWHTEPKTKLQVVTAEELIPSKVLTVVRSDIGEYRSHDDCPPQGFEVTCKLTETTRQKAIYLTARVDDSLLIAPLVFSRESSQSPKIEDLKIVSSNKSKAHIDFQGAILNKIGVISGWAICKPGVKLWLIDSDGNKKELDSSLRFHRNDIGKIFSEEYSTQTVYAGFVTNWPFPQKRGNSIAVVEEYQNAFCVIAKSAWTPIADDPISYARYAFTVPTPAQDFDRRLESWEGEAISGLIEKKNNSVKSKDVPAAKWRYGPLPMQTPTYSVIVPLYGRWDFVEHQLNEFSKDAGFKKDIELIYVIDDPTLITPFINEAENLLNLYGVPFSIVWGHRNRGFSGANNLGVANSSGEFLLLLNSDVFPTEPGWIEKLSKPLATNPDFGMIGAKLLFPDGGLQHGGMTFLYSQSWSVWLNKHPWAGLSPELDNNLELLEKPAVTGACIAMRRSDYLSLGGFDEGYLIGDFEDSDLCMKVRSRGMKIGYLPAVVLTHLERQSFSLLGDNSFRTLVVRYNAWRHTKRWGNQITELMSNFRELGNE